MIPHLEMFRYDPAATLRHSPVVIRPLKRTVTLIPMIFVVMSFLHLVIAVLIFVVGNGILQLVQGESIFEDIDSIGTKVVLSIGLILYVASIPIAIFLAHLSLRGVCPGPDQDNHMNWLWKSLLLFPV